MVKRVSSRKFKPKVISIEGIHGVGKTTAFNVLKRSLGSSNNLFYPERLVNKPLFPFGSKDKQVAFRSEIHFLQQMMERNKIIEEDISKKKGVVYVLDRSAICVLVYSKALDLHRKDFQVLTDLFNSVNWYENILIYLEASPETILNRISKRSTLDLERLEWNEDDFEYIIKIQRFYEKYISKIQKKVKIIKINTNNLNIQQVSDQIYLQIKNLIPKPSAIPGQELIDSWIKN